MAMEQRVNWAVRPGFLAYLAGLSDLQVTADRATAEFDGVGFSFESVGTGMGAFTGHVHLVAHGGALQIHLGEPRIIQTAEGVLLEFDTGSGRSAVARLLDASSVDEVLDRGGSDDVALTVEGSILFGGTYGPWARMSPLIISPTLQPSSAAA